MSLRVSAQVSIMPGSKPTEAGNEAEGKIETLWIFLNPFAKKGIRKGKFLSTDAKEQRCFK
jgi:hypothetical protein